MDADSISLIAHLMVDLEFLRDHALERIGELIENQGWDKLFLWNYTLNIELVRQFFSTLTISSDDSSLLASYLSMAHPTSSLKGS